MDPLTAIVGLSALLNAYGQYDSAQRSNAAREDQKRLEKAKSKWAGFRSDFMPQTVGPEANPFLAALTGVAEAPKIAQGFGVNLKSLYGQQKETPKTQEQPVPTYGNRSQAQNEYSPYTMEQLQNYNPYQA